MSLVFLVLGVALGLAAWHFLRMWRDLGKVLKRRAEMTASLPGTISELKVVSRRNRSYRWKNEIPVVSYTLNGVLQTLEVPQAEDRAGRYRVGAPCTVLYVPAEPDCCLIQEFADKMASVRRSALVVGIIFAVLAFNLLSSAAVMLAGGVA